MKICADSRCRIAFFPHPAESANPVIARIAEGLKAWRCEVQSWKNLSPACGIVVNWGENFWLDNSPLSGESNPSLARNFFLERLAAYETTGTPRVWVAHNLVPHQWSGTQDEWLKRSSTFFSKMNGVVYLTDAARQDPAFSYLKHLKSTVVHHPTYDTNGTEPLANSNATRVARILFLDSSNPRKNSIEAARVALDCGLKLVFFGESRQGGGPLSEALKSHKNFEGHCSFRSRRATEEEISSELTTPGTAVLLNQSNQLNSGVMFLALSHGARVFAPASPSNAEIKERIGSDWLKLYESPLSKGKLNRLLAADSSSVAPFLASSNPTNVAAYIWGLVHSLRVTE